MHGSHRTKASYLLTWLVLFGSLSIFIDVGLRVYVCDDTMLRQSDKWGESVITNIAMNRGLYWMTLSPSSEVCDLF